MVKKESDAATKKKTGTNVADKQAQEEYMKKLQGSNIAVIEYVAPEDRKDVCTVCTDTPLGALNKLAQTKVLVVADGSGTLGSVADKADIVACAPRPAAITKTELLEQGVEKTIARVAAEFAADAKAVSSSSSGSTSGAVKLATLPLYTNHTAEDGAESYSAALDASADIDARIDLYEQLTAALLDAGAQAIQLRCDATNSKAAMVGMQKALETASGANISNIPILVSTPLKFDAGLHSYVTVADQSIEAWAISVQHLHPWAVGLELEGSSNDNVAADGTIAEAVLARYENLAEFWKGWCFLQVSEVAEVAEQEKLERLRGLLSLYGDEAKILNVVSVLGGGAASATAEGRTASSSSPQLFTKALPGSSSPRALPKLEKNPVMHLSGRLPLILRKTVIPFVNVGERCNLMGSLKFKRLIGNNQWGEALEICREQVQAGAQVIDYNMDADLIEGRDAMRKFLSLCLPEAEIANVPWMLDSSKFEVVMEGLKLLPGKSIVNSISLKVGEEEFKNHARTIRRFGCAVVVMAFDEQGQAVTMEDKVRICERSFRILTEDCSFPVEDIIFDCNVLTIATGLEEHNAYGIDFINAVERLNKSCAGVSFSGGLSNLSFSFRGLNEIREAMHAVFLYHAIPKGLNMSIVNAGALPIFTDIDLELRTMCEEVIMNKSERNDHVERFLKLAEATKERIAAAKVPQWVILRWAGVSV